MKVCIAEKPSVGRDLAHVLGARTRKDGYFEGNGYQVTWTFGHLCTLLEPHDYNEAWKRWRLEHLPMVPEQYGIKVSENGGVKKQFSIIKKLISQADEVINCGDAGQEGELIQRWVLEKAGCTAPVQRLWISSLTEDAIREGFNNLRPQTDYDRLYAAGSSRAIGDWILGINATRLYTLRYGDGGSVLSVGRVQTPTLAMIVTREREIEQFVPQPFWELQTVYRETTFTHTCGKFKTQDEARELLAKITGAPLTIDSVKKKQGKELPPKLFDLTSLQVECNRRYGYSADQTLKSVQKLYEKKLVTYPRVDTTYLPLDVYPKVSGILKKMTAYGALTEPLLQQPIKKSKKIFDDTKITDHHAIIPTQVPAARLAGQEASIYDSIARRFIAAFYPDCIVSKTGVRANAAGEPFKVTGKQILEPGWRAVVKEVKEKKEEDEQQRLPAFTEGESGPHTPRLADKKTKPPKYYTEASLLRAMETAGKGVEDDDLREALKENGIGRPSTRAGIIETLFRRHYIRREKKTLRANPAGIALIDSVHFELLKSAELTGSWEKKLREIEKGAYDSTTFIGEMNQLIQDISAQVKSDRPASRITIETAQNKSRTKKSPRKNTSPSGPADKPATCPLCSKGRIIKGRQAYGCSRFKEGCDYRIYFEQFGNKLTDSQLQNLVIRGKTGVIQGLIVNGEKTAGTLALDERGAVIFSKKETPELTCPKCGKGTLIKGKQAHGCCRYREGCDFRIPFELHGKKLTDSQLAALVTKRKTAVIKGFVKDGEKFNARLGLNEKAQLIKLPE